jgi:hypothetical protein
MSKEVLENEKLTYGLMSLIVKLDDSEDENLIADIQEAVHELSFLNAERGIEILVAILSKNKYTYKGEQE